MIYKFCWYAMILELTMTIGRGVCKDNFWVFNHDPCSVIFMNDLLSHLCGTTEGQAVYIAWKATSPLPIFYPGTQPFTIPSTQPRPEEDPIPNSIQVRRQPFSNSSCDLVIFLSIFLFDSLYVAFYFDFIIKHKWRQSFFVSAGKVRRHAHPHRVQWNNVPHPLSLCRLNLHLSRNQLSLQQDLPSCGRGTPSPRICVLSRLCLHSPLSPARPKTKMVSKFSVIRMRSTI